jgi:hypothetical protein
VRIFKPYSNIKDFLHRFTLLKIGRLHIRLHKIMGPDVSGFFHSHPFKYLSIVLRGSYIEDVLGAITKRKYHGTGSFIFRGEKTFHKIIKAAPNTMTLFITWGNYEWRALNLNPQKVPNGLYQRTINEKNLWAKRENDIWFVGNEDYEIARKETRHSIHQFDLIIIP